MNWFKKSIGYDQGRKLIWFFVLGSLAFILFDMMFNAQLVHWKKYDISRFRLIDTAYLMYFYVFSIVTTIISIGVFNRSEVGYIPSMPLKRSEIIYTKVSCAASAICMPVIISLIVMTLMYLFNLGYLNTIGFYYSFILISHIGYIISGLFVVGILYLMSLMYSDIKVPLIVFVIGAPSVLYITGRLLSFLNIESFDILGEVIHSIYNTAGNIIQVIGGSLYDEMVFYPWYIGWLLIIIGILGLLYVLIMFMAEKYSNDIYIKIFPFKISKILVYTGIYFFGMVCVEWLSKLIIEIVVNMTNMNFASNDYYNVPIWIAVLAFPILIKVTNKIVKKIEDTF